MYRMTRLVGTFAICFALATASSFAEEMKKSTTSTDPTASAGSSETAAPAASAPEAPAAAESAPAAPAPVAPPALKPITITFSGEVASVASSENPPMIAIQDRYGVKKEIAVPSDAKIMAGTASKPLSDLKAGDKVTVEYTYDVATGKRTAQTITVGEEGAAPAAGK